MTTPDYEAGALAMRDRIADGIRRWWESARARAGHRFPGHPHWLEVAVRKLGVADIEKKPGCVPPPTVV